MLCSYIIAIYADDLDTLDRDTKLLHISTSKFACQVKCLDLQQLQGFQSALPLCVDKVDIKRLMNVSKLAAMPPLNLYEVMQQNGLFYGLNTINDNLVLYNRKNGQNLAGIIAGVDHSGKTFQNKREIFNALISTTTNDHIVVVSGKDEYDGFIRALDGEIHNEFSADPFEMIENYGLSVDTPDTYSKSIMLEALIEVLTRPTEKLISMGEEEYNQEAYDRYDAITEESSALCRAT